MQGARTAGGRSRGWLSQDSITFCSTPSDGCPTLTVKCKAWHKAPPSVPISPHPLPIYSQLQTCQLAICLSAPSSSFLFPAPLPGSLLTQIFAWLLPSHLSDLSSNVTCSDRLPDHLIKNSPSSPVTLSHITLCGFSSHNCKLFFLTGHLYIFIGEMFIQFLCSCLNWVFFLLLSVKKFKPFSDIKPLSDIYDFQILSSIQ